MHGDRFGKSVAMIRFISLSRAGQSDTAWCDISLCPFFTTTTTSSAVDTRTLLSTALLGLLKHLLIVLSESHAVTKPRRGQPTEHALAHEKKSKSSREGKGAHATAKIRPLGIGKKSNRAGQNATGVMGRFFVCSCCVCAPKASPFCSQPWEHHVVVVVRVLGVPHLANLVGALLTPRHLTAVGCARQRSAHLEPLNHGLKLCALSCFSSERSEEKLLSPRITFQMGVRCWRRLFVTQTKRALDETTGTNYNTTPEGTNDPRASKTARSEMTYFMRITIHTNPYPTVSSGQCVLVGLVLHARVGSCLATFHFSIMHQSNGRERCTFCSSLA